MRLDVPRGVGIRPTTERVRAALFSILQPRISGAAFLDLYAGTGANGIEALSRGASLAVFVDRDRNAVSTIEHNLLKTRLRDRGVCFCGVLPEALSHAGSFSPGYDVVYADPPYDSPDFQHIVAWVSGNRLVGDGGVLIVEHGSRIEVPVGSGLPLQLVDKRKYGSTCLSFFA